MKLLVINGPNLNMLGLREKEHYGNETYEQLKKKIENYCESKNIACRIFQSNHEGEIIDEIQKCYNNIDAIIINPAAYTHTSIAIADALACVKIPTVEVHLSRVSEREDFRKISFVRPLCFKTIEDMGTDGYLLAVDSIIEKLGEGNEA